MLPDLITRFEYYKTLGDRTMAQLNANDLFKEPQEGANSIAIIVKHMWGNMRSRWTDFLTTDGEKPWRNRDSEFANDISDIQSLTEHWEEGWEILFNSLHSLTTQDLSKTIFIRKEEHLVIDAIHRQLAHYAYHVGQIVFIGKLFKGEDWKSLSIPKGGSSAFNDTMMRNQ